MDYAEFMRRRGIPYPSPLGGNASVEAGTVEAAETLTESVAEFSDAETAETPEPADATLPDAETAEAGSRNRRKSSG